LCYTAITHSFEDAVMTEEWRKPVHELYVCISIKFNRLACTFTPIYFLTDIIPINIKDTIINLHQMIISVITCNVKCCSIPSI
jgi:hypothetical protein